MSAPLVRKAVITAAGRGTRQFPATRSIQKEMLPLVARDGLTKPALQIIVEDALAAGIESICIVVERGGQGPFAEHFRPPTDEERRVFASKPWALVEAEHLADLARRITYVEQPSPEGFGHAVYQARDWVGDEPFLLLLGDHLFTTPPGVPSVVAQMRTLGARLGGSVTAVRLEPEAEVGVTGILRATALEASLAPDQPGQTYDILELKEKPTLDEVRTLRTPGLPEGQYLGHLGIHLFTPDIFACLGQLIETDTRVKNEFQLTSAQQLLLERARRGDGPPYRAAFPNGARWDIGVPEGYLETLLTFAQRGPFAARLSESFGLRPTP